MLIRLEAGSTTPLFDQITAAIRRAVADGQLRAGERLPPARTLAASLGVNMHTVLRAYQQLRDEGLVELRRGRGAVLTANGATADNARLSEALEVFIDHAQRMGLDAEEAAELVRRRLS